MTKRFTIHFCPFDRQCRSYGAPARLSLSTPWWHAAVAVTPGSRFVEMAEPWKGRWVAGERFDWTQVPMRSRWTDVRRKEQ